MSSTRSYKNGFPSKPRINRFIRPDEETGSVIDEGLRLEADSTSVAYNNPFIAMSIQQQRNRLPIARHKNQLLYLLEQHRVVVVVGETGSGKSTQLPQYLVEAGWASDERNICITQPRRVAAVTLAARVAEEMGCLLGTEAGYAVRFEECCSKKTKIKFVTDGILLRELLADPLLTAYSVVIVDEAHERSVNTDLVCGFLKKIIEMRLDIRLIIASATIDAEMFRDYFELNETNDPTKDSATIVSIEGRMFPIQIFFTKVGVPDYVKSTVDTIMQIHATEGPGDILAFLTGQDEVERACEQLRELTKTLPSTSDKLLVFPLYGGLPAREQFRAFGSTPYQTRKVIVATNIAETSVTITGVVYVVDCGFVKMRVFNSNIDMETLMIVPCSRSSADQRAGRAGRVRPGKCFRLYSESEYRKLPTTTIPEVQRGDLTSVVLRLQSLGVQNVLRFNYLSRPSSTTMVCALNLLSALGAIDSEGQLTSLGRQMSDLPLAPTHAKALIASAMEFECSHEVATIIAMLQIKDVFISPSERRHKAEVSRRSFAVEEGDHLTLLNVYTSFVQNGRSQNWCNQNFLSYHALCRAEAIREQLVNYLKHLGYKILSSRDTIGETAKVRRAMLTGFFSQVARYDHTGLYITLKGESYFKAYKGSVILYRKEYPKWVFFTDLMQNSIKDISEIDPVWLEHLASHYYDFGTEFGTVLPGVVSRTENYAEGRMANLN